MRLGSTCNSAGLFMCLQASVYAKPMAARAHQPAQKMPVVGFLNGGSAGPFAQYVAGFTKDCVPKLGGTVSRKPITGIAGCCACATSRHVTAPPSSDMNWRRLN